MDFYKVIYERDSIRNYDPDHPVSDDVLRRILDAGRLAPSAANRQPWTFYLVSSPEYLSQIRECYGRSWYKDAPHILVVSGKTGEAWVRKEDGYNAIETDLTIAMDHMILAAKNEGVGSCWIASFDYVKLKKILNLGDEDEIFAITPLGYPREGELEKKEKIRKSFDDVVRFL